MRRRRRGLSYLPPEPTRTPFLIYLLVAGLCFGAIFFFKNQIIKPVSGKVLDAYSGKPVVGATVLLENDQRLARTASISDTLNALTDLDGSFSFDKATDNLTLNVSANYYRPEKVNTNPSASLEITLRPKTLRGIVKDPQGKPLVHASVTSADKNVLTDSDGSYVIDDAPEEGQLVVKAAGYKPATVPFKRTQTQDVTVQNLVVKGVYLRAAVVADGANFQNILNLISVTELNTVVIDLKDSNGWTYFDSKNPLARLVPEGKGKISNLPAVVKSLKEKDIYTIARISVFQDGSLTDVKPEWAIKSRSTGKLWADSARFNWANPYLKEVWNYNIDLAREAAISGFDEIQFAFVQFPSSGQLTDIDYGRSSNTESRVLTISGFLKEANLQLNKLGVFVSVEVMGQSVLESGDLGIGQDITQIADQVDYISPVLFPSYFGANSFGFASPAAQPYEVINKSLTYARTKLEGKRAQMRPWLQDFSAEGTTYSPVEVRAEIQATEDVATNNKLIASWLLWNAEARYSAAALRKK
ncbi:putative glycoside hydrolase [Candidatus Chlorohelix sp.]|uniref:putative glycoside hydrolase n=1 Tax=Candidatus Chlorohelix sp. TaxID=3139201 RepID=UPI0030323001